jgi:hypothetical protein
MNESKEYIYYGLGIDFTLPILFAALGYFVYNGVSGALAMLILTILYALAGLLSIIPFAGAAIQWAVMAYAINPFVFHLTHIHYTWLVSIAFWVYLAFGIIITAIITIPIALAIILK